MANPYRGTPYRGQGPVYDTEAQEAEAYAHQPDAPGPSGMQSGVVQIGGATVPSTRPSSATQIVRWNAPDAFPSPLTVIVHVSGQTGPSSANPFAAPLLLFAHGDGQVAPTQLNGVLRFTIGAGAAQRVIECDLKGGHYQIPPCTALTVEAFVYGVSPAVVNVSAAVVPGRHENPTRPMNTVRTGVLTTGQQVTLKVPFGARWAALYAGTPTQIGAGQPSALLTQASGAVVLLDWVNGVLSPPPGQFVELADRTDVIARVVGTASLILTVRFGLEL